MSFQSGLDTSTPGNTSLEYHTTAAMGFQASVPTFDFATSNQRQLIDPLDSEKPVAVAIETKGISYKIPRFMAFP